MKNRDVLGKFYWENTHPAIIHRSDWEKAQALLQERKWSMRRARLKDMPRKFVVAKVKSGSLRGYYLLDADWSKDEREKFVNIITSLGELEGS